eukprot:5261724-Ditylum_brightwellii.AAC.1
MEQSKFMVVTDNSAQEIDMSFGWKICALNRDIIAEHLGPAFGQASSFRAEAMLCYQHLAFSVAQWSTQHQQ